MVHGGGHHHHSGGGGGSWGGGWSSGGSGHHRHHHHGGGWFGDQHHHHGRGWFGESRPYQSSNVVVVNNGRGGGWSNNTHHQNRTYHRNDSECEDCCAVCCRTLCICCVCCAATPAVRSTAAKPGMCKWIVISAVVFCVLLVVSGKDDSWTLNAGESRRVSVPWLTHAIKIHSSGGANVYVKHHKCPKLKGPKIAIDNSIDITLAPDDYQNDFFYLNAGSTIDVTVEQSYGASNLLLFRGQSTFDRWENDDDYHHRDSSAIVKRFVGANQKVQQKYKVPASDYYVAVYDNASSGDGHATVTYHAELTTYKLDKLSPVSTCDENNTCLIDTENRKCILVEAPINETSDDEVTVSIKSDRKWGLLAFLSCIPILIGLKQRRCSRSTSSDIQTGPPLSDNQGAPPLSDNQDENGERPPPYAPIPSSVPPEPAFVPTAPSAPVEEPEEPPMAHAVAAVDYDSIAIPVENVIPVPPPQQQPTDKV